MSLITRLLCPVLLAASLPAVATEPEPLEVFVSLAPQQTFVEAIGGDRVEVHALVAPGESPHLFEPRPRQIAALAEADLFVRIGASFEEGWLARLRAANPELPILDAREGIELRQLATDHDAHHDHDHGHDHHHGEIDTHIWTSPPLVRVMAGHLRDTLGALDPAHAEYFAANHDRFVAELDALDAELRERLAGLAHRRFMVYHPAWGYFAATYGLEQVAIERAGKEPGARALTALIEQARREDVRLILVQPQLDPRAAERVAEAIDGRVEVLDPLSPEYFATLRRLAALLTAEEAR
ncbi:metal ABC transporter solute-binding protein, Zn/Mn family [Marichromatium sp. AB31]|uniref:metal ABC transporter solute-binding protein, Zn/Mn family n=1 Tax=Marichromatium sp. AB31 TaxID=2483362 RepID=UPI000F3D87E4|nr:zinc ABC transporter substrate-binding protein [Marichromatium sp. AB31]RNE88609.1 ABC transporter substrate-binding protein [Marichromatium sp. AB31]